MRCICKRRSVVIIVALVLLGLTIALYSKSVVNAQDEQTYVTKVDDGLTVTYLGTSARMDYDEYTKASVRFGYKFELAEGYSMDMYTWNWEYSVDGDGTTLEGTRDGEKFAAYVNADGEKVANTYCSNLVLTGIPAECFERTYYVKLTVTTKEGTAVSETVARTKTVRENAEDIAANSSDTDEQAYATGINDEIATRNLKVNDLIYATLSDAVEKAAAQSTSQTDTVTIVVRNTVEVSKKVTVPSGKSILFTDDGSGEVCTILRSSEFTGKFFEVENGATLKFKGTNDDEERLVLDGNGTEVTAKGTMISIIESDTVSDTEEHEVVIEDGVLFQNATASIIAPVLDTTSEVSCSFKITGSRFYNNKTTKTSTYGGAVRVNKAGYAEISGAYFENNSAASTGGGALGNNNNGYMHVTNCTFKGNTAKNGGAIALGGTALAGQTVIEGCLFKENGSDITEKGAAIYTKNPARSDGSIGVSITGCTFENNASGQAAVYLDAPSASKKGVLALSDCDFTYTNSDTDTVTRGYLELASLSYVEISGKLVGDIHVPDCDEVRVKVAGALDNTSNINFKFTTVTTDAGVIEFADADLLAACSAYLGLDATHAGYEFTTKDEIYLALKAVE